MKNPIFTKIFFASIVMSAVMSVYAMEAVGTGDNIGVNQEVVNQNCQQFQMKINERLSIFSGDPTRISKELTDILNEFMTLYKNAKRTAPASENQQPVWIPYEVALQKAINTIETNQVFQDANKDSTKILGETLNTCKILLGENLVNVSASKNLASPVLVTPEDQEETENPAPPVRENQGNIGDGGDNQTRDGSHAH